MNQSSYKVKAMFLHLDVPVCIAFQFKPGATSVRVSDSLHFHEFKVIFIL